MSVAPTHPLPLRAAFTREPIFRLTVDQYHELIRSGKITDDDPVELLEGILASRMPKNTPHATSSKLARREMGRLLPDGWHYQSQEPITLGDGEPEPDGAVIRGRIEDYALVHPVPEDVALVIEVADTSVERDRGIKLRSYARAGIAHYWIINLVDRHIEAFTEPTSSGPAEPTYLQSSTYLPGDSILLILPGLAAAVPVGSLLPPL